MTGILAAIVGKIGLGKLIFGSGLAVGLVLTLAKKYVPAAIGKWFAGELQKAMNPDLTDPLERAKYVDMVKAICIWVEYKCPDTLGPDKLAQVKALLMRFMDEKNAAKCVEIINEAVATMNEEMKKATTPK